MRHLLERHNLAPDMLRLVNDLLQHKGLMLRTGTAVDATLISAPSSTKNAEGERDPEMRRIKKGNNWYVGMKARIGVDAHSGLVHTVIGTAANVNDLNVAGQLLHGEEHAAFGDAGYQGVRKRPEAPGPTWQVAMRPGLRRKRDPFIRADFVAERVEKTKASIRAKVEHPFGFTKVRYRGPLGRFGSSRSFDPINAGCGSCSADVPWRRRLTGSDFKIACMPTWLAREEVADVHHAMGTLGNACIAVHNGVLG